MVLIGILTAIIMHFVIASDVAAGASAPAATSPFWRIHGATSSLLGWAAYGVMVYFLCQPNVVEAFEGVEDKRRISY